MLSVFLLLQSSDNSHENISAYDLAEEISRRDYNCVLAKAADLPEHKAKVPSTSLSRQRAILTEIFRKNPKGFGDADLDSFIPAECKVDRPEVTLEQPLVKCDQLIDVWRKVKQELDPEDTNADPVRDAENCRALVVQVRHHDSHHDESRH